MKFTYEATCSCGSVVHFAATGDQPFGTGVCSSCGRVAHLVDPLSVCVTAEKLLYRSRAELQAGDFSLSIVIATIAVESYLTGLFLKLKGMENYALTFQLPSRSLKEQWETEYPRSGGFLKPGDFVAKKFTGQTFDHFVLSNNVVAAQAFLGLPNTDSVMPSRYFQNELFSRRNRIAHWGYINSTRREAEHAHQIAVAIVTILREMDRLKYHPS